MMDDPRKVLPTSKVIELLQQAIDLLKTELDLASSARDDYRLKLQNQTKRNDLFVEQLANVKHENDMVQALLKRKERRVLDLEEQCNDLSIKADSMLMTNKHLQSKCDALEEQQLLQASDYGRLKISYDALVAGQAQYRDHYGQEVAELKNAFEKYKENSMAQYLELSQNVVERSKDTESLLEGMRNRSRGINTLYTNKNALVVDLLQKLALATEAHGQESKQTLSDCHSALEQILKARPDLDFQRHDPITVDIEKVMAEARLALADPVPMPEIIADTSDDSENQSRRRPSRASVDLDACASDPVSARQKGSSNSGTSTQQPAPSVSRANSLSWKRKKGRGGRGQSTTTANPSNDKENALRTALTKWAAPRPPTGTRSRNISPVPALSPSGMSNQAFPTYQMPYQMQQYAPQDMAQPYPNMPPHPIAPQYTLSGLAENLAHTQYYLPQAYLPQAYQYQQLPYQQLPYQQLQFAPESYVAALEPMPNNGAASSKRVNRRSRIMSDDSHSRRHSQQFDVDFQARRQSQHFESGDTRRQSQHFENGDTRRQSQHFDVDNRRHSQHFDGVDTCRHSQLF